jgi:hypothetical protein
VEQFHCFRVFRLPTKIWLTYSVKKAHIDIDGRKTESTYFIMAGDEDLDFVKILGEVTVEKKISNLFRK